MGPVHDRAHRLRDGGKSVGIGSLDRFENQREIGAEIRNRFFRRRPISQEDSKADSRMRLAVKLDLLWQERG